MPDWSVADGLGRCWLLPTLGPITPPAGDAAPPCSRSLTRRRYSRPRATGSVEPQDGRWDARSPAGGRHRRSGRSLPTLQRRLTGRRSSVGCRLRTRTRPRPWAAGPDPANAPAASLRPPSPRPGRGQQPESTSARSSSRPAVSPPGPAAPRPGTPPSRHDRAASLPADRAEDAHRLEIRGCAAPAPSITPAIAERTICSCFVLHKACFRLAARRPRGAACRGALRSRPCATVSAAPGVAGDRRLLAGRQPAVEHAADGAAEQRRHPEQPELAQSAQPPANTATAVLRAGLTEVLVTGIEIRWIRVRPRPIASGAKPAGALPWVAPMMMNRNIAVITTSVTRPASRP